MPAPVRAFVRAVERSPLAAALAAFAVGATLYTVVYPIAVTRYVPLTDLPFHAAFTSAFRHYFDDAYQFRAQFELQPLAVPYLAHYVLGAVLMLFLPVTTAVNAATALMLGLLPAGLAVLLHGLKKSPVLSLASLPLVWTGLTHWGFVNFVAALGLFAMALGLALSCLDRPTRARRIALCLTLFALFFTHVFRFPFAVAAVLGAVVLLYPATRRVRAALLPTLPPLALFAVWWLMRPESLGGDVGPLAFETGRLDQVSSIVFGAYRGPEELAIAGRWLTVLGLVAAASAVIRLVDLRSTMADFRPRARFIALSHVLVLGVAGTLLALFLVLPMEIGIWWYVYPREIVAAIYIGLAALPDLPKHSLAKAPLAVALGLAGSAMGTFVAGHHARFDRATEDFHTIVRRIPQAPKLLYLVFDHGGTARQNTPFIHLPAYVQAEKGGWLSFHFAGWGTAPLRYRTGADAVVPPPTPLRWEWTPQRFRVREHGAFFDWFLVRHRASPDALFRADPTIERVDHAGTWWLYKRSASAAD